MGHLEGQGLVEMLEEASSHALPGSAAGAQAPIQTNAATGISRHEAVRQRAYELWEAEGRPDGHHERHWGEAEDHFATDNVSESDEAPASDEVQAPTSIPFASGQKLAAE